MRPHCPQTLSLASPATHTPLPLRLPLRPALLPASSFWAFLSLCAHSPLRPRRATGAMLVLCWLVFAYEMFLVHRIFILVRACAFCAPSIHRSPVWRGAACGGARGGRDTCDHHRDLIHPRSIRAQVIEGAASLHYVDVREEPGRQRSQIQVEEMARDVEKGFSSFEQGKLMEVRMLKHLHFFTMLLWFCFGVVDVLHTVDAVPLVVIEHLWGVLDVGAKVLFSSSLTMTGVVSLYEAEKQEAWLAEQRVRFRGGGGLHARHARISAFPLRLASPLFCWWPASRDWNHAKSSSQPAQAAAIAEAATVANREALMSAAIVSETATEQAGRIDELSRLVQEGWALVRCSCSRTSPIVSHPAPSLPTTPQDLLALPALPSIFSLRVATPGGGGHDGCGADPRRVRGRAHEGTQHPRARLKDQLLPGVVDGGGGREHDAGAVRRAGLLHASQHGAVHRPGSHPAEVARAQRRV